VSRPTPIDSVLETVVYAADLDAAERFYGGVLGLERFSRKDGSFLFFRVGRGMLLVFDPASSRRNTELPPHGTRGAGHVCLAVPEATLDRWKALLATAGIAIEHEQAWPAPRQGRSLYVRDPAGNSVELATPRIWGIPEPGDG